MIWSTDRHGDKVIPSRLQIAVVGCTIKQVRAVPQTYSVHSDGHALLTHNCLRSAETNARNPAWFEMGRPPPATSVHLTDRWKKEINELPPLVKQNLHYLCRRGSVRYARLCPADLNSSSSARPGLARQTQSRASMYRAADETHRPNIEISSRSHMRMMRICDRTSVEGPWEDRNGKLELRGLSIAKL